MAPGWTNPANWSTCGGTYPGANSGDTALIGSQSITVAAPVANGVILNIGGFGVTVNVNTGGTLQLEASSSMGSGGNALTVTGGSLTLNNVGNIGPIGSYTFTMSSGSIQNIGTFNEPFTFGMSGGTLTNGGTFAFVPGGVLNLSGGNFVNNGTVNVQSNVSPPAGIFTWSGGTLDGTGVTNVAAGTTPATFSITGPVTMNGSGTLNSAVNFSLGFNINSTSGTPRIINGGTMTQSAVNVSIAPKFDNSGTVSMPISGMTLSLLGGGTHSGAFNVPGPSGMIFDGNHTFNTGSSFSGSAAVVIQGGIFMVNINGLTIPGNLTNSGSLTFGGTPGIGLPVSGTYSQNPGGSLSVRLNGPSAVNYDQVRATGAASIAGTINATLGYTPTPADVYDVITDSSVSGDFTTFNFNSFGGFSLQENPSPPNGTQVRLQAVPNTADINVQVFSTVDPVAPGANELWQVAVTNFGSAPATNLTVAISIPNGTIVNGSGGGFTCVNTSPTTANCTNPSFPISAVNININATAPLTAGNWTLTATGSSATPDPNPGDNTQSATVTVSGTADMTMLKVGPASVNNGANATFTLKAGNGGPNTATNVVVTDSFFGGTFVSATPTGAGVCSGTTSPFTCSWPSIANGGTETVTVILKATGPPGVGSLVNTGSVTASETDPNSGNNASTVNVTVNPAADLKIASVVPGTNPVTAAQPDTWSVGVSNAGPDPASSVTVNISVASGTISGAGGGGFTCTNTATTATCTIGSIANGANPVITVNAIAPPQPGNWNMTATVSATTADPTPANNTFTGTATVTGSADMQITKTGPASLIAGANVTYTINVKNAGPSDAVAVQVNDAPPAGWTFVNNSGACVTTFPCNLGTMTSGQIATFTSTFHIPSNATGIVTNTATVSSTTPDPIIGNNTGPALGFITQQADLYVTKIGPASTTAGSTITYTITVTNSGPSDVSFAQLSDPTPAGLTFVSASGGCAALAPCNLGAMTSGQVKTITATFTVNSSPPNPIVNTASVSSPATDPVPSNNSASATTTTMLVCPTAAPTNLSPANGAPNVPVNTTLSWSNVGAGSYKVFFGKQGTGCSTLIANVGQTSLPVGGLDPGTVYEWRVEATTNGCTTRATACQTFTTFSACPTTPPVLASPTSGTVTGQTTFTWNAVSGATAYHLFVNNMLIASVMTTTVGPINIANGPVSWYVVADFNGCPSLTSSTATFNQCNTADPPVPSIVANAASGQGYDFTFTKAVGTTDSEVQESSDPGFGAGSTTTQTTSGNSVHFQHSVTTPTAFYYRVRSFLPCANAFTSYSLVVRIVLAPNIAPTNPNFIVPAGNSGLIQIPVHVPGFPGQSLPFMATLDNKPWLKSVTPSTGILPPEGVDLIVTADITGLPNGTFTGTVILLVQTSATAGNIREDGVTPVGAPVSVSLVTPVTPKQSTAATANSVIIPSVGHLDGINSHWQSDIRVANITSTSVKYQLTFTPDDLTKGVKQTIIDVAPGATTALDDMIRTWYGVGSLGETANGVLEIHPVDNPGKGGPANEGRSGVNVSLTAIASSRAYNVTSQGTLGQFIPALPFSGFIGKAQDSAHAATVLGIQQIAQNADYRTNVGVLEASGNPASVMISAFNAAGDKLLDFPLDLKANEQRQLNSFLATNNISVTDGRLEVKVTGGDGKVTTYASVVDNHSGDPLLVAGVPLGQNATNHFVLPGVADLNTGFAAWRTDMTIFNPTTTPQFVTMSFYPQNSSAAPQTNSITINAGQFIDFHGAINGLFGLTNTGGALHLTTNSDVPLVVTGRTFNQTSNGTFGQFVPAVTAADAVGKGDRSLQILQAEDSVRYRTNLGIAEVTGKPATVEVQVILPDSKISPSTQIPIAANGFIQVPVIQSFGLSNVYNARISLRVVDGDGKVSAYGSVIDQQTQDPTYIPAQK